MVTAASEHVFAASVIHLATLYNEHLNFHAILNLK